VSAAAGFSRTTGSVGVATVTRGPGFANAVNALKAATHDHVPLLLLVAESPASKPKISQDYQNLDQRALTATIGAGFHHAACAGDLERCYWAAVRAAQWNGLPQVVSLADGIVEAHLALSDHTMPAPAPRAQPDPDAVSAAVDALIRAERPLVLAGQGAVHADCRADLEELADLVGARVASTLNVNRFFSGHPHDLGVCGQSSPAIVREELERADVVLAVGASLNNYTTGQGTIFGRVTVIQCEIDIDQPFRASDPELGLIGDARETVRALVTE
jgi:acetolactate synthase-1/2/3 large subunit